MSTAIHCGKDVTLAKACACFENSWTVYLLFNTSFFVRDSFLFDIKQIMYLIKLLCA